MIKTLCSTTAIILFSGAMAVAQTDTNTAAGTSSGIESWDQTTRDAFFGDDNTLRSDSDIRTGWDSLDSAQQAKLRADCMTMQSDAGASGSTGTGAAAAGTSSDTSGSAAGADTSTTGSSDTSGSAAGTATTTTGTSSTAGAASSGGMQEPDMASLDRLCSQIQSF